MMVRRHFPLPGLAGLSLALGLALALSGPVPAGADPGGDYVGTATCLDCHDDVAAGLERNIHWHLKPYEIVGDAEGCESCHGAGGNHVASQEPADILSPTAVDGGAANTTCLVCHATGPVADWEFGMHAESDVACVACHTIHGNTRRALLADAEEDVCFSCHMDQQAKFQLPSHHPLKEGFMTCSSCHESHGKGFREIATGETTRDACLVCHQQHAGPFVFEHSPVMEDCAICHDVHGTVANNLLKQNEPFICLQCHQPHFHSILAGYEGDYGVSDAVVGADPGYEGLTGTSQHDSWKRVMLTKCTQCHQSIHGSDLPSQSITGQGRALNR